MYAIKSIYVNCTNGQAVKVKQKSIIKKECLYLNVHSNINKFQPIKDNNFQRYLFGNA